MPKIADTTIRLSTLETVERRQIYRAMRVTKGNLSHAARLLGIDRRTLYRKLEKYDKAGRVTFYTIDYVSAYPVSLTEDNGSITNPFTSIGAAVARVHAKELTEE